MKVNLKHVRRIEVAIYPNINRTKWVVYCAAFNLSGWGWSRAAAIACMRHELEDEEKCPDDFESGVGPPAPGDAEIRTIERMPSGRWI